MGNTSEEKDVDFRYQRYHDDELDARLFEGREWLRDGSGRGGEGTKRIRNGSTKADHVRP